MNSSTIQSLPETKGMLDFVILRLPLTIRTALGKPNMKHICHWDRLHGANKPDGSSLNHITTPPRINRNPLVDGNSGLRKGDEELIVKGWARIHSIAIRNNRNIIYFVPPVYETKRNSLANRIFDDALHIMNDKYPEIIDRFIDDRYVGRGRPDIFVSYDHPNETYYKELIERAYDRKLLKKSALPPISSND